MFITTRVCFIIDIELIVNQKIGFDHLLTLEYMDKLDGYAPLEDWDNTDFYDWYNWSLDSEVMSKYKEEMFPVEKTFYTHFSLMSMHGKHMQRDSMQGYYDTLMADSGDENGYYVKMWEWLYSQGYVMPPTESSLTNFLWYKAAAMDVEKNGYRNVWIPRW